jgi:hypothetical protein
VMIVGLVGFIGYTLYTGKGKHSPVGSIGEVPRVPNMQMPRPACQFFVCSMTRARCMHSTCGGTDHNS